MAKRKRARAAVVDVRIDAADEEAEETIAAALLAGNAVRDRIAPAAAGGRQQNVCEGRFGHLIDPGGRALMPAPEEARQIAQRLIDDVADHAHLREARVLIVMASGYDRPNPDGLVSLGKAAKAPALLRLVAEERPDFLVRLNGLAWATMTAQQRAAAMDHELTHCAAAVAKKYVKRARLADFVARLGADHIETVDSDCDEAGRIAVRFRRRRGTWKPGEPQYAEQPLAWRIRKHDIEEFDCVAARHEGVLRPRQAAADEAEPADDGQYNLPVGAETAEEDAT